MEFLVNNSKGLCSKCGELLGFIELKSRELFCYNCEDYIILPMSECLQYCNRELKNLRESFRELIVEGDAKRYLRSYLNILEKNFISIESPRGIDIEQKIELLQFNQHFFITMTLAIKWILEDLNFKFKNNNEFSMDIASNIQIQWYTLFQQKAFLENELGMFISKSRNAKPIFYYYQFFDFYQSTLNEFSTFHKDELNSENYEEKIAEFISNRNNPKNIIELAKYDFPLTYICSLYNFYPDKEDRIFSFEDIANFDVPKILEKLINIYDEKRYHSIKDLEQPGKHFFAITSLEKLREDLRNDKFLGALRCFITFSSLLKKTQ